MVSDRLHPTTPQEAVDRIIQALGAFVLLGFLGPAFAALSGVINPLGILSGLAALAFGLAVVALCLVVLASGHLYQQLE